MSRHILSLSPEQLTAFDLDAFVAHAEQLNQHHRDTFTTAFPKAPSRWLSHYEFTPHALELTPEGDIDGGHVLSQMVAPLAAGDRDDVVALGEDPGEGDLRRRDTLRLRQRCDLAGDPTFAEALARVRSEVLAGLPHQGAPFGQVVQALRPDRSPGRNPLFQHMLVLMNVPDRVLSLPGLEVEPLPVDTGTSQFDLSLDVHPRDGGLLLTLEHATDLYDRALAPQVLDHFVRRLDAVVDFPLPDEDERRRLWELHLRPGVPRTADIDLDFLATAFRIPGGNIAGITLTAGYRAAADPHRHQRRADSLRPG